MWTFRRFLAIAMLCGSMAWADAQEPVPSSEVEALKLRLDEQQRQIDELALTQKKDNPLRKSFLDYRVRGRIDADAVWISQSPQNKVTLGDIENAVGFRRARLGVEGTAGPSVNWISEFDFAGGDVAFRDVFVGTTALPWFRQFQVGHFREPFSLEGQSSSNAMTFMERSPGEAFNPGRNWGVGFFTWNEAESLVLEGGIFASGTDRSGTRIGDGNDASFTMRGAGSPWYVDEGRGLLHVGAAYSYRSYLADKLTFSQAPQSNLLQPVDNPLFPLTQDLTYRADHDQRLNLQAATNFGRFSIQAEWTGDWIEQIGRGPVFLHAAYAYVSVFVTGEHRHYIRTKAAFFPVKVLRPLVKIESPGTCFGGFGAWELAARFAYLDLRDANNPLASGGLKTGGSLTTATFGVNWYLTDHARVMFNFSPAALLDPNFGKSYAEVFGVRTSVFW